VGGQEIHEAPVVAARDAKQFSGNRPLLPGIETAELEIRFAVGSNDDRWSLGSARDVRRIDARFTPIRMRGTRLTWVSCGVAAVAAAAALSAQAAAPGVRIVRDSAPYDRVWPADMNGDGRADLISSTQQRCGGGMCTGTNAETPTGAHGNRRVVVLP